MYGKKQGCDSARRHTFGQKNDEAKYKKSVQKMKRKIGYVVYGWVDTK
jgi:hypothetical protein